MSAEDAGQQVQQVGASLQSDLLRQQKELEIQKRTQEVRTPAILACIICLTQLQSKHLCCVHTCMHPVIAASKLHNIARHAPAESSE